MQRFLSNPYDNIAGAYILEVKVDNLKIIYKKTEDLIPYINNPRNNDNAVDKVASSIKNFGFKVPIVVDGDNEIIAGHTRLKAAKKLGMDEVPCIVADDLSDGQIKAFRLADNRVAEFAEWDMELLESELEELKDYDLGFDFEDVGMDFSDLEGIETATETVEAEEDDFDEESVKDDGGIVRGDLFQLGNHRLMCGDSTDSQSVKNLSGGVVMNLLITDPPYNVNYEGATKDKLKIENDNMSDEDFVEFLSSAFTVADEVMEEGAAFYIWHGSSASGEFIEACNNCGWEIRQQLIWNKDQIVLGRQDYQWKHEPCFYGWKSGAAHNWYSDRKQTTVLDFDKPVRNGEHPTMKPVKLFDYQIRNSSKVGDNVLDLFGGSGTTIIACEQNNRNAFVMEYDPHYVNVIIKRWEELTGKKAIKLNK